MCAFEVVSLVMAAFLCLITVLQYDLEDIRLKKLVLKHRVKLFFIGFLCGGSFPSRGQGASVRMVVERWLAANYSEAWMGRPLGGRKDEGRKARARGQCEEAALLAISY
ncbi:hypothetical protein C8Q72DRAFT_830628 [Fomitopsis betulina]|nr:hypothetical protein C8Q72DRAFT_830628 [Fomitopsis betulina]